MYKNISYLNGKDELQKRLDEDIRNYLNVAINSHFGLRKLNKFNAKFYGSYFL